MHDEEDLKNISEDGHVPTSRMTSAMAVRGLVMCMKQDNEMREKRNALIKGLVDGNPPYNQAKLDESGQKYRSNFNNGEAESYLNIAQGAFYDLFSEVPQYAVCEVDDDDPASPEWSQIETSEFQRLQEKDDRMDWGVQLSHHDMVLYGSGPQIWEDDLTWRSRPAKHNSMLLCQNAASSPSEWDRIALTYEYRVDELYEFIADAEAAKRVGWNIEAVKKAIIRAGQSIRNSGWKGSDWSTWGAWQQAFRNNDWELSSKCTTVSVSQFIYREFRRGDLDLANPISEAWVDMNGDDDDFLFQKTGRYKSFKQVVCPFFYDRGDGTAHSVRGLGVKLFRMLTAKNRLQCATMDAGFANATTMVQPVGQGGQGVNFAITNLGPYTVLPFGYNILPRNLPSNIDGCLAVSRDVGQTLESNLSQYRSKLEKPEGNPRTAYEIASIQQQAATLGKTQINRYYEQLDDWYQERFRRACNTKITKGQSEWCDMALEFQKRCKERGVPEKAYAKTRVKAYRSVGQGSAWMRLQMLNQILSTVSPFFPEEGKQNLIADIVASSAGRGYVNRYVGNSVARVSDQESRWQAQIENDSLRHGGNVMLTDRQNDVLHLDEHIGLMWGAVKSLDSGADPKDVWATLQTTGTHSGMHLQRMEANPARKAEAKLLGGQIAQLAKISDKLAKQIQENEKRQAEMAQKQTQARAVTQGVDPDTQIKQAKAQQDMRIKEQKAQQKQRLDEAKARQKMAIADASTANNITLQRAQAVQQSKLNKVKAAESAKAKKD